MNRSALLFAGALSAAISAVSSAGGAALVEKALTPVADPPLIQMLVPGFTVRELPLQLNNINNLVYAPDGRLFALGYDGNVHQLKDTDGDGLEDTATFFYKNDGNEIKPSIGMAWGPGGLYIASQGRVIRLRDKGDGTSELETITGGWVPPTGKAGSSLDAVGLAVDPAGNVYFGLGCDNWREAYRVNKETGKSEYNINSERGTILKLSPDFKTREVIATGLRFTVSLAFHPNGDLFCSEQEGATWLPNGNPFDELLHIQKGRHYGFPPRHPLYLPNVIDEPSVFDYAPQHQSTCGLHFNEPVAGGANTFGPAWWRGDAFVSGESRGKIYRTKVVKTAAGYVARNDLIACLSMLTIDAVPTPQGDLIVTCHSGKPDWGTGPQGKGRLFKISYRDKAAPQPVFAYAAGPSETRVVFDRPLDPTQIRNLTKQSRIEIGRYVSAGDRFESFRPGYQAVKDQLTLPRYELPVLSAGVTPDNRALVLQTAPHAEALNCAVTVPRLGRPEASGAAGYNAIDLLSDRTGLEVAWQAAGGKENWNGWLPHLNLAVARTLTAASAEHERLFKMLNAPGRLNLRGQLDLWLMLNTVIQPLAKLDFEYSPETVTVVLKAGGPIDLKTAAKVKRVSKNEVQVTVEAKHDQWLPLDITLVTGAGETSLEATWFTAEDARPRAFPLRRMLLPWARPAAAEVMEITERSVPEIAGGDWQRGRKIFFSDQAACFKCHQMNGEGGRLGPDLSNLIYRDYASVMKDITQPSAAINPDHIAYNLQLKDGETLNGVIVDDTAQEVVLGQATGASLKVPKKNIASMKASAISLMPEGLLQALNAQQQKDLLTFLLTTEGKK